MGNAEGEGEPLRDWSGGKMSVSLSRERAGTAENDGAGGGVTGNRGAERAGHVMRRNPSVSRIGILQEQWEHRFATIVGR